MRYLAFDLGASSGKLFAGRIEHDRLCVERVHAFPNRIVPYGGGLYWDFLGILSQMEEGVCRAGGFDCFGIDSFNNDFSLLDRAGALLTPVRCYRDGRTKRHEAAIYERLPREELYFATGNQLGPFNTLMQLAAMALDGQSALWRCADTLLFLPDLLAFSVTGLRCAEYTVAAETQFYDSVHRRWLGELPGRFGVPERILPQVVQPGTVLGRASRAFCMQTGAPPFDFVSVCQHDTASAFLAASVENAAYLSSGTWSLVGIETSAPVITPLGFAHNVANEGGFAGTNRLLCNVMGSWLLQELRREYAARGAALDYGDIAALASGEKPGEFWVDPNAPEFFSPGQMCEKLRRNARAACGKAPETPGQFFRCVYEGLAFRYLLAIEILEELSGRRLTAVNVFGGGSRDAFACQCIADMTQRPVLAGPADASAIGNLLAQMLAKGEISDLEQGRELVRRSFPLAEYRPQNVSFWNERREEFRGFAQRAAFQNAESRV